MRATDVHENLANLSRELVDLLVQYRDANLAKAKAEQTFKVAYATAYLAAEGSIEERKQRATLTTADAARDAAIADVQFDNLRAAMRVLGQRLDAGRTIASTIRAEAIATGVGV